MGQSSGDEMTNGLVGSVQQAVNFFVLILASMKAIQEQPAGLGDISQSDHGFAISLMEHLVVPTFVIDASSKVLIWNRACERLTGIPAQELIGTSEHWRAFYSERRPCLADLVLGRRFAEIGALYASGGNWALGDFGVSAENWCVMPNVGRQLYLAIDAGPIYDASGCLIAVVETLRDITVQKRAQTDLEALAARDGLTGLANRRSFDLKLEEEARRACRDQLSLSLLMIDIDCFKAYNDTYGHQKGDECLKAVAQTISRTIGRASDFAARYGGEEFAVILPNTPRSGALLIAEHLRRAVEMIGIAHSASIASGHITLSIGGVATHGRDLNSERLLASADAALYLAKREGRNRISVHALDALPSTDTNLESGPDCEVVLRRAAAR
jgi:diguanylate cyclase (GGDEF)-like protein